MTTQQRPVYSPTEQGAQRALTVFMVFAGIMTAVDPNPDSVLVLATTVTAWAVHGWVTVIRRGGADHAAHR